MKMSVFHQFQILLLQNISMMHKCFSVIYEPLHFSGKNFVTNQRCTTAKNLLKFKKKSEPRTNRYNVCLQIDYYEVPCIWM